MQLISPILIFLLSSIAFIIFILSEFGQHAKQSQITSFLDYAVKIQNSKVESEEPLKKVDPLSYDFIKTKMIKLKNRPDLGFFYDPKANLISTKQNYATIVANLPASNSHQLRYFFNIPIACQAWRQIGFGCLIIIPYQVKDVRVKKAVEIVKKYSINLNDEFPGSIIILEMKVDETLDNKKVVQVAQVSRIFVGPILRYSMNLEDFATIENSVYLVTTDVDLLPLSTSIYRDLSHDFQIVNTGGIDEIKQEVYMFLSCVGASIGVWNFLMKESYFSNVKYFNSTGILQVCDYEKNNNENNNNSEKLDWYMDQHLISKMMKNYLNTVGWDKAHERKDKNSPYKRVGRGKLSLHDISQNHFHILGDKSMTEPYKDAHFCQNTMLSDCWWNLYHLLKRQIPPYELQILIDYRAEFLDEVLENENLAMGTERNALLEDEKLRQKWLKEGPKIPKPDLRPYSKPYSSNKKLVSYDIRKYWTAVYPRIYADLKPIHVDWQNERVFQEIIQFDSKLNNSPPKEASDPKLFEKAVSHLADKLGVSPSDIDPDRIIKGKTVIYKVVPRDNLPLSIEKKLLSAPGGKELFLEKK